MTCEGPRRLVALLLLLAAGCSAASTDRFVPKTAAARQALEAALKAWKDGQPAARIESHNPPIEVVDSKWRAGRKLASYEITGEDTNLEGHRRFTVKLTMQKPAGTQEARFIVLGQDPLWVYREEDYKRLSGM